MEINERKKEILEQVILNFIEKAEPVSSQSISENMKMNLSSATVRKEMAELEEMGYLMHLHTSSGRVPTDKGYRFYIDFIVLNQKKPGLLKKETDTFLSIPLSNEMDIETLLAFSTDTLSKVTSYLSMIAAPEVLKSKFRHIEILKFDSSSYLIVLITDSGRVHKKRFLLEGEYNDLDLQRASNLLNGQAREKIINSLEIGKNINLSENDKSLIFLLNRIILIIKSFEEDAATYNRIFIKGALGVFKDLNFIDFSKINKIINILEDEELLMQLLTNYSDELNVNVKIGSEIYGNETCDLSMVASKYRIKGNAIGSIGVIGPKRMNYVKIIDILINFRDRLTGLFDSRIEN